MSKHIVIVGGGAAGWITACYLARTLGTGEPCGVKITLIESSEIGILGVGEGTTPSIRKTLMRIGLDEADFLREANGTFKHGVRFAGWRGAATTAGEDAYFHPFQVADQHSHLDLMPHWLLGLAGDIPWDAASSVQMRVADAMRAPKLASHQPYAGPLNYAYHFDASAFASVLQRHGIAAGVTHLVDTIETVTLDESGAIAAVAGRAHGPVSGDLYIDCTGFRARLIGDALGQPVTACRNQLFCDRAVTVQLPYSERRNSPRPFTVSTAQEAGWIWDIDLQTRRGIGHVYSSAHSSDDTALAALERYVGASVDDPRLLRFEAGYRETQWHRNCVAIGLSAGFIEPLEATGLHFAEIAALILANLFPWNGDHEASARVFNAQMRGRYAHVLDFIKLHYALSRRASDFWRDNRRPETRSAALSDKLDRWRNRPPSFLDVDENHDIFREQSWQFILYGAGFATDLSRRPVRFTEDAKREFASIRRQGDYALTIMPDHRMLLEELMAHGFRPDHRECLT